MEFWRSYGHGHDQTSGNGMDSAPLMNQCDRIGTVGENFRDIVPWQEVFDFESMLEAAGITEYARFICEYHIHGRAATVYDSKYCALDWYFQSAPDRMDQSNIWEHHLILDQVCPTMYHEAHVVEFNPFGRYEGWTDFRIGS